MKPPLLELGGRGPTIHFAVGNGFPPPSYLPLLEPLFDRFRVVCIPPRALWPDVGDPPATAGSWESLADDLLTGFEAHGLDRVLAIGHSFGGVATLLAAEREPARFRGLALLDPTIIPPDVLAARLRYGEHGEGLTGLVTTVLRRRRRFASAEEAFAHWRPRPMFRDWPERTLRLYAESLLTPTPDGEAFTLRWTPEWEAWYYASFYPGAWDRMQLLPHELPLLVMAGEVSDTYLPSTAARMRTLVPWGRHVKVPGAGHLFPLTHPGPAGDVLEQWVRQQRIDE